MTARHKFYEVFIIRVVWTNDIGPYIGPVVGITRAREVRTVIRQRLKASNQSFKSIEIIPLRSVRWFFAFDFMQDPVDRLLASVGEDSYNMIDQGWEPRQNA